MFYVYVWSMQIEIWSKVCFHGYGILIYLFIFYCAWLLSRILTDKGFQITLNTWCFFKWIKLLFACKTFGRDGEIFLVKDPPSIPQLLQDPQAKHLLWRIKKMIKPHHDKWVNNWHFSFCLPWAWSSDRCLPTIRSHYNPLKEISQWPNQTLWVGEGKGTESQILVLVAHGEKQTMWEPHGNGK